MTKLCGTLVHSASRSAESVTTQDPYISACANKRVAFLSHMRVKLVRIESSEYTGPIRLNSTCLRRRHVHSPKNTLRVVTV